MKFNSLWKKHPRIHFIIEGRPPRKSMWGKEDAKLIFKLRKEALKARSDVGLHDFFNGPVKIILTVYAPNVTDREYKQSMDNDPKSYVGDLDSFVAGVCESLQPAPTNPEMDIKIFEGHDEIGPEIPLIIKDDAQVVSIDAKKIIHDTRFYTVTIESVPS